MVVRRQLGAAEVPAASGDGAAGFWQILANFRRSVLGCIGSYDSESRRILQLFSRSTRLAYFCTAQTSKLRIKINHNFAKLNIEFSMEIADFFLKNCISHSNLDEILSGFREHVQKCLNSLKTPEILQNFDEKSVNFPKLVKNSIEKFNISILSLLIPLGQRAVRGCPPLDLLAEKGVHLF